MRRGSARGRRRLQGPGPAAQGLSALARRPGVAGRDPHEQAREQAEKDPGDDAHNRLLKISERIAYGQPVKLRDRDNGKLPVRLLPHRSVREKTPGQLRHPQITRMRLPGSGATFITLRFFCWPGKSAAIYDASVQPSSSPTAKARKSMSRHKSSGAAAAPANIAAAPAGGWSNVFHVTCVCRPRKSAAYRRLPSAAGLPGPHPIIPEINC